MDITVVDLTSMFLLLFCMFVAVRTIVLFFTGRTDGSGIGTDDGTTINLTPIITSTSTPTTATSTDGWIHHRGNGSLDRFLFCFRRSILFLFTQIGQTDSYRVGKSEVSVADWD